MIIGKAAQDGLGLVFTVAASECFHEWQLLSLGFIDYDLAEDSGHLLLSASRQMREMVAHLEAEAD